MKKLLIVCSFILLFSQSVLTEEIRYFKTEGYKLNRVLKRFFKTDLRFNAIVKKSTTTGTVYLYFDSVIGDVALKFKKKSVLKVNELLEKFYQWSQKAKEKEIKITKGKKIGEISILAYFKYGDWQKDSDVTLEFYFFSDYENEKIQASLGLIIEKMQSNSNEFITIDSAKIMLFEKNIENFKKAFDLKFINNEIEKILIQREEADKEFE